VARIRRILGLDSAVVFGDLLRPGILGRRLSNIAVAVKPPTANFSRRPEFAAADIAVNVTVKEVQQVLWKILRFHPFHAAWPFPAQRYTSSLAESRYPLQPAKLHNFAKFVITRRSILKNGVYLCAADQSRPIRPLRPKQN
jgi:hypothetical protein